MRRLPGSPETNRVAAAERPAATGAPAGDLTALRERLRNLAPNHVSAIPTENGDRPPQPAGDRPPAHDAAGLRSLDSLTSRFWDQVDHFRSLWQDHQHRWPRPSARDRTLAPDQDANADQVIEVLQECEPAVTDLLQRLEAASPFGARLMGLEHRLKGPDRLKEKLAESLRAEDVADVAEASRDIFDAVRYTYCFDVAQYAEGYADMHERLESAGYKMIFRANRWIGDLEYSGLNTRWLTPDGDRFELQFHTPESFFTKESLTHEPYERLRDSQTIKTERDELRHYQQLVCSAIPEPDRVDDIPDVRPR